MSKNSPATAPTEPASSANALHGSLLDKALLTWRSRKDGSTYQTTLPELFAALAHDAVRDFPALRPHQRHPWHAFLAQLGAIALHHAGHDTPWTDSRAWREALLALTPDDPDGAAWCLVSPPDRPALMQPAVPNGSITDWKNRLASADELDMLVTSKNHDLKAARMQRGTAEDWLFALVSLQTHEGFLGAGNYGISRMNGGFASRPAVGAVPVGGWGRRWQRDVSLMVEQRAPIASSEGLALDGGVALVWLSPWDGQTSLTFASLSPHYIEVCRRVRLIPHGDGSFEAACTGSTAPRIAAKERNGVTGDAWTPVDISAAKALTITDKGYDYKLATELMLGGKYKRTLTQQLMDGDGSEGIVFLMQGVTRGQGKTEGYHERRIPISRRVRQALRLNATDSLAKLAEERVHTIGELRKVLWSSLCVLLENGERDGKPADGTSKRANTLAAPFEQQEDTRFFDDLFEEIESDQPVSVREQWLLSLADRAEAVLKTAFHAGPRSGIQRYRAQSAALGRFHGSLRRQHDTKLPELARLLRERSHAQPALTQEEDTHEPE
jgi:CRISPR system Cascade subunit CasA